MARSLAEVGAPRRSLRPAPTAIERVAPDVWVMREDLAGDLFGGNKLRKLEWILAHTESAGSAVLTIGPAGSNHVAATSLLGARAGLKVHAVLIPQPDHAYARVNARIIHAHAERVYPADGARAAGVAFARAWTALRVFGGVTPHVVPAGGSDVDGVLGWTEAGIELAGRIAAGELPTPARVFVAVGTGGTAAGLLLGLRLGGCPAEIVGVRVTPRLLVSRGVIVRLARAAAARLRPFGFATPRLDGLRVEGGQLGDGYAIETSASTRARAKAAAVGLPLDPTYTSKAWAQLEAERDGRPSLFVATCNNLPPAVALEAALPEVSVHLRPLLRPRTS